MVHVDNFGFILLKRSLEKVIFESCYLGVHFLYLKMKAMNFSDLCVKNGVNIVLTAFQ